MKLNTDLNCLNIRIKQTSLEPELVKKDEPLV